MAIAVAETRQALADAYAALGDFIGTCTDDPGVDGAAPANETTGGTPPYARKQTVWTPGVGGVTNGSAVTIDVPASTISFILLGATVAGDMIDSADVTDVVMSAQGQLVVTPTMTIT